MGAIVLWIEGKGKSSSLFLPGLRKKGIEVETASSGSEALARLSDLDPDLVVVNAADLRTSGRRICHALHDRRKDLPILLISNPDKAEAGESVANVTLTPPFTLRKLLNRIIPLLPGNGDHLIHRGPIRLDMELHKVRSQGREAKLTPKLSKLLKAFLEHPGELLERAWLIKQVWQTDYTGDTRTLDVHISWLRQAIEENPRKPRFLKTIRGMGYRLDV